jgi:hypothetical protein
MTPKTSFTKQKAAWKATMTPNPKTEKRCATVAKKVVPAKKASATVKYHLKTPLTTPSGVFYLPAVRYN